VKNNYNDPRSFILNNRYLISDNYKFVNHSAEGWSYGSDVGFAEQSQQSSNGWRVHVTGNNPGIVSPQFSGGILATGAIAHFSMKAEGTDPQFTSVYGKVVCGKVWVKDETGSWNNSVNIELANKDYHYDPDNDGNYNEYNSGQANFYRANFSSLRSNLLIKQFSIELTDGYGAGNIYWRIDSLKMFEKIVDGTVNIASSGNGAGNVAIGVYKPQNMLLSSVSQNSVTLSWNQGANAILGTDYHVYAATSKYSSSANEVAVTTNNSYSDVGLSSNTKYYYWVKAAIGSEMSDFSDSVYATTQSAAPDGSVPTVPTNLTCGFESNSQVKLRWSCGDNNPNNIAGYKLFKGTTSNPSQAVYLALTSATEQEVSGLNPSSAYYFWVKAVNHNNQESGFSAMDTAKMADFFYPPENLTAVNSNGSVNLSWSCQPSGLIFRVYRSTMADFSNQFMLLQCYMTSYADNTGQNGTTYYYRVCSTKDSAVSDYSNPASATVTSFPAPDSFRVVETKFDRVRLAWKRSPGTIYNYWIFRGQGNAQQWSNPTNDTFYVDSSVIPGQTYYYKIRAHSSVYSGITPELWITIPFKKKVYQDFVILPDADSNGFAEIAYLYKKGEDSTIVSILDLGNDRVLQTYGFSNYSPNSLVLTSAGGQLKLIVALDSLDGSKTVFGQSMLD